jgi:hypothetical protein
MIHPAAFIPSKAAKRDLIDIVRQSKLTINGVTKRTPDGARIADNESVAVDDFHASYDLSTRTVTIAPIWLDFFDWHHLTARSFAGGPNDRQDYRLRLTIKAKYEMEDRWGNSPVLCETQTPSLAWVDSSSGTPTSEPGIVAGSFFEYYFYVLRVAGGVITERTSTAIFKGWPYDSRA